MLRIVLSPNSPAHRRAGLYLPSDTGALPRSPAPNPPSSKNVKSGRDKTEGIALLAAWQRMYLRGRLHFLIMFPFRARAHNSRRAVGVAASGHLFAPECRYGV